MASCGTGRLVDQPLFQRWWLLGGDVALCGLSYQLAFVLRFMPHPVPPRELVFLYPFIPLLLLLNLAAFLLFGTYRQRWRYLGIEDTIRTSVATTVGTTVFAAVVLSAAPGFPRGVIAIHWVLAVLLLGGSRLLLRMGPTLFARRVKKPICHRTLILGSNDLAESLARELARSPKSDLCLIGFLADSPDHEGQTIHGHPVLGKLTDLSAVVRKHRIDYLILALPEASGNDIRRIISQCEHLPVQLRIAQDPWKGHRKAAMAQIRNIRPEDLLRRPPVRTDLAELAGYLEGQVVMVTGAGGSIGSELARQIVALRPRQLLLLGRGENSVFKIQQELVQLCGYEGVPLIADIRDRARLEQIFARYQPAVVFHAAAHKHVPLMESNAPEAIKNNVLGTRNLLELSERFGVETFILISTDKAVNPTSVMGSTKRVAELLIQARGKRASGRYMAVRFGNVLGSRGSVVPTIQWQIARGLPVTITHPEMERFFMTIPEAAALTIQAGAIGNSGEIFVLDMGEPVRILDLARDLVRLGGLVPDRDVQFRFTGIRPGEKLTEETLTTEEGTAATRHDRIFIAPPTRVDEGQLVGQVDALVAAANREDDEQVRRLLHEIVCGPSPVLLNERAPDVPGPEQRSSSPERPRLRARLPVG